MCGYPSTEFFQLFFSLRNVYLILSVHKAHMKQIEQDINELHIAAYLESGDN